MPGSGLFHLAMGMAGMPRGAGPGALLGGKTRSGTNLYDMLREQYERKIMGTAPSQRSPGTQT